MNVVSSKHIGVEARPWATEITHGLCSLTQTFLCITTYDGLGTGTFTGDPSTRTVEKRAMVNNDFPLPPLATVIISVLKRERQGSKHISNARL